MTVEDIKQNGNKNPSDELIQMIDSLVMTYKVTTEERDRQVKAIIEKGRAEELSDKQIRGLIEISLHKHGLSDRTIYRALPDELKDKTKQHANLMRKTIGNKPLEDREVQKVEPEPIDIPVPQPTKKVNSWDDKPDSEMTLEELRERNRQNLVSQGKIPDSVYREPDRVESRPQWNKDSMDTVQEQSFRSQTMKVEPNVPVEDIPTSEWLVHNQPQDYTVTTQLQIHNGTGNNTGQFTVDVVCHCYPMNKTVELEPIDKATIKKVKQ